jgi:hypothetical protein
MVFFSGPISYTWLQFLGFSEGFAYAGLGESQRLEHIESNKYYLYNVF